MNRRNFLGAAALGAGAMALPDDLDAIDLDQRGGSDLPAAIQALQPMTAGIVPITDDERKARIAKAQRLMAEQRIDAIFMEGGTSSFYYVGMRWGQSERTFGVVIPAKGAIAYVCPGFEEDRARELIKPAFGDEVRTWQEDESPFQVIGNIVKDRGISSRKIGIEERVRFFVADGIRARHRARGRRRDADHRRLPDDQDQGGDRADAARQRRHAGRLQGRARDDAGGDDPGRTGRQHHRGLHAAGIPRRDQRPVRQVDRAPARQRHAAEAARR